jgi:hypothetical protein
MASMFFCAEEFNQPLQSWKVDNVVDMTGMFRDARTFDQPLSDWKVKTKKRSGMFDGASNFSSEEDFDGRWPSMSRY